MTTYGPSAKTDTYVPDSLIAGEAKVITGGGVIKSGAAHVRGEMMGQRALGTAAAVAKAGGNTGAGVLTLDGATPVLANAQAGVYTVRLIVVTANSGTFEVKDPKGESLGQYVVGGTFADQIKFAIADGNPDFALGDGFDITVAAGDGKYVKCVKTATDGSAVPSAILIDDVDATDADMPGAFYLAGEFNGDKLTLDASWSLATATDALRRSNIYVKGFVPAIDPDAS